VFVYYTYKYYSITYTDYVEITYFVYYNAYYECTKTDQFA
jgi:hypothetical protein